MAFFPGGREREQPAYYQEQRQGCNETGIYHDVASQCCLPAASTAYALSCLVSINRNDIFFWLAFESCRLLFNLLTFGAFNHPLHVHYVLANDNSNNIVVNSGKTCVNAIELECHSRRVLVSAPTVMPTNNF